MVTKNRYYRYARISEDKFRQFIRCYALDLSARETAALTGLSVRSVNTIYLKVRRRIAAHCELETARADLASLATGAPSLVAMNEPTQKDGDGLVFAIGLANGKVQTRLASDIGATRLRKLVRVQRLATEASVTPALWASYNALADHRLRYVLRVDPDHKLASEDRVATQIQSFINFAKRRWQKFNGVPAHTFYLHLKETEFRFNRRGENLNRELLRMLRAQPLEFLPKSPPKTNVATQQPQQGAKPMTLHPDHQLRHPALLRMAIQANSGALAEAC